MTKLFRTGMLIALLFGFIAFNAFEKTGSGKNPSQEMQEDENNIKEEEKLVILWTSGDRDVALKMVFMYTLAAKKSGWWKEITFIVWGPSQKLLCEDPEIQEYIPKFLEAGIVMEACLACANMYEVADDLEELDIDVIYMGVPLTEYIKSDSKVITF